MRHPLLHLEADGRGQTTPYGGLALARVGAHLDIARRLDARVRVFKRLRRL